MVAKYTRKVNILYFFYKNIDKVNYACYNNVQEIMLGGKREISRRVNVLIIYEKIRFRG